MSLIITKGPGYWKQSPFGERARGAKLSGIDVQQLWTDNSLELECKCGYKGTIDITEQQGKWFWGECPICHRPYIGELTDYK